MARHTFHVAYITVDTKISLPFFVSTKSIYYPGWLIRVMVWNRRKK